MDARFSFSLAASLLALGCGGETPLDDAGVDSSTPPRPDAGRDAGRMDAGFDAGLDELRVLARDSSEWLAGYQQRLTEQTGIPSLKVGFNKVFGYYIEVTAANQHVELPGEYVRKQTTKNAERYVTDELKTFESKVLKAALRIPATTRPFSPTPR